MIGEDLVAFREIWVQQILAPVTAAVYSDAAMIHFANENEWDMARLHGYAGLGAVANTHLSAIALRGVAVWKEVSPSIESLCSAFFAKIEGHMTSVTLRVPITGHLTVRGDDVDKLRLSALSGARARYQSLGGNPAELTGFSEVFEQMAQGADLPAVLFAAAYRPNEAG